MHKLDEELFTILTGSRSDLTTSQLVARSSITNQPSRVSNAMFRLMEQGKVKLTGDGRWHQNKVIHFNGNDYMVGENGD